MRTRLLLVLALLLPFVACGVQWLLWDAWIKPYVWFLFFPTAFFSAWLGGLRGGVGSTVISALLVWYFFIPPQFSFALKSLASGASIMLFVIMGGLFSWFFERLNQAIKRTDKALEATELANQKITALYEKTLELDELKSQFFANVSHELRTPLTLIMAPLENQLRRPVSIDYSPEDRRDAEMMLRNARLLYRHVSDLLDVAKIEAGGMRIDYIRFDLAELVRALASHFDSVAREHGIAYRVAAPPTLAIEADAEKLQRILLNLLSNAFKFTPDGGAISVRLHDTGGQALIEVQDNGPGVPDAMRETVFERFRQVEGTANRRHGGTGLGLAIVKEFVALHGGEASVTAAPGGGALFAVRLPLDAPAGTVLQASKGEVDPILERQAQEELIAPSAMIATDALTAADAPLVLVVEDNADMNAFIVDNLRSRYRVASARDGRAGLEQALALTPDLILSDVMMPVMSGDEMVLELRRHIELADVPVVMLTARADDALRVKLLQAGVQGYLSKPFAVEELLARVDGLITDRRRSRNQVLRSEQRFRQLFEQAPIALSASAADGRIELMNRAFMHLFGYEPDELQTVADWRRLVLADPEQREVHARVWQAKWQETEGDGKAAESIEQEIICKNGAKKLVLLYRIHLGDNVLLAAIDLTERKAVEDELRRRNEELERFDHAATGRELKMIELKRQVNLLATELGRDPPYDLAFAEIPPEATT